MKNKEKSTKKEEGITLIVLIITIIVLVILAAVTIKAVYDSNIIGYAVNGATNYASEATRENEILDQTESIIQSAVDKINDIAGGSTGETPGGDEEEEPEDPIVGIDFGNLTEEERNKLVGKYVDYTPVSGSFTSEQRYNGSINQDFLTDIGLKWKILKSDRNKLTLISDRAANTGFYLGGANGYNNGVLLLNNASKEMYSNSNWATGRSLDIDDIEDYSTYSGASLTEVTPIHTYYPIIFEQEINGAPKGSYGTNYDLSDQNIYETGTSYGDSSFKAKQTYYTFTMSTSTMKNQNYIDLFSSPTASWLASRCVYLDSDMAHYAMFYINADVVNAYYLYYSLDRNLSFNYALRPVVEIDLTKANVGETGDGGENTPYSIEAK